MSKELNLKNIIAIESENIHQRYTGELIGRKHKAEYIKSKKRDEDVVHKILISCDLFETSDNDKEMVEVEVQITCHPLGIKETVNMITPDSITKGTATSEQFYLSTIVKAYEMLPELLN